MKTAYAYARFSSDNQREESITAQLRAIHEYCNTHDIRILQEFKDEAFSARTDKRPAFQELFARVKERPADYLIVHKLDRFARNRYDAAFYRKILKDAGMRLVSVLERLDDTPESIIMEGLLESMNEYYSANLYVSIPFDRLPCDIQKGDEVSITINTYKGEVKKEFSY